MEDNGEAEAEEAKFFIVRTTMDDTIDPSLKPGLAFTSPLVSAAIKEAGSFDPESKPVLIVRYPVAGLHVTADEPTLGCSRPGGAKNLLTLGFRRDNEDDFLTTLFPNATSANRQKALRQLNLGQYGTHVDYQVLNRIYQALAPPAENWMVEVELLEPYFIKDLDSVQMVFSKESRDILILAKLENATIAPDAKKAKKITMEDLGEDSDEIDAPPVVQDSQPKLKE